MAKHKRPGRTKESINMAGLKPWTAPDLEGKTVTLTVRLEASQREWVQQQAEATSTNTSYIMREALRLYQQHIEGNNV